MCPWVEGGVRDTAIIREYDVSWLRHTNGIPAAHGRFTKGLGMFYDGPVGGLGTLAPIATGVLGSWQYKQFRETTAKTALKLPCGCADQKKGYL